MIVFGLLLFFTKAVSAAPIDNNANLKMLLDQIEADGIAMPKQQLVALLDSLITQISLETKHEKDPILIITISRLYAAVDKLDRSDSLCNSAASIIDGDISQFPPTSNKILVMLIELHSLIATKYYEKGDFENAGRLFRNALIRWKQVPDAPILEKASLLTNLGLVYQSLKSFDSAEVYLLGGQQILMNNDTSDSLLVAACFNYLGLLYFDSGQFAKADTALLRALHLRQIALGEWNQDVAITLNDLAKLKEKMWDFVAARDYYGQCIAIWHKTISTADTSIIEYYDDIVRVDRYLGNYREAEQFLKNILAIEKIFASKRHHHLCERLVDLAGVLIYEGKFSEAEGYLQESLDQLNINDSSDLHLREAALLNLSVVYAERAQFGKAEQVLQNVVRIRRSNAEYSQSDKVAALLNLGNLHCKMRDFAKAESECMDALNLLGQSEQKSDLAAEIYNLLAMTKKAKYQYDSAENYYQMAMNIWQHNYGIMDYRASEVMYNMGLLYMATFNYRKADSLFLLSLQNRSGLLGPEHFTLASTLESLCKLKRIEKDYPTALELSYKACFIRNKWFGINSMSLSESDALRYASSLSESRDNLLTCLISPFQINTTVPDNYINILISTKGQVSDEIYRRQRSHLRVADSAMQQRIDKLNALRFEESKYASQDLPNESANNLHVVDSLSRLADSIETTIAQYGFLPSEFTTYNDIRYQNICSLIDNRSALIEYYRFARIDPGTDSCTMSYAALVLTAKGNPILYDLGPADSLDFLIKSFHEHMKAMAGQDHLPTHEDRKTYQEIAYNIYKCAFKPIVNSFAGRNNLTIAADGPLSLIPFDALVDDSNQYLIDKFSFQYLFAARDMLRRGAKTRSSKGLIAFGNPDYYAPQAIREECAFAKLGMSVKAKGNKALADTKYLVRNDSVTSLPFSEKEVIQAANNWNQFQGDTAKVFTGCQASEEVFKSKSPGNKIIHLATHGFYYFSNSSAATMAPNNQSYSYYSGNPLLGCGILLAGANLEESCVGEDKCEDGHLTALEVSCLDLSGTDLVVLSSCQSGLGITYDGEGTYGLLRAFFIAGAKDVVSTLWQIDDLQTSSAIDALYSNQHTPIFQRLRYMKLNQIKNLRASGLSDHPYSWAGFVATGAWK